METWQRANPPIPELCNTILNTCQMPSRFYIIPSNVNKSQTHLLKPFTARDLMEGHISSQNTLMFALVFCFELRARAARTCRHCRLAVKKPIHDGNRGQLKLQKSHERYHYVVMWHWIVYKWRRSKQMFSSHIFQFTRLHGVAVMQGLTYWDSVVTLVKSAKWCVLSGTGFLVAHQLYIGNWQIKSPPALWRHLSFECLGVIVALNGKSANMVLEPTKNKLNQ